MQPQPLPQPAALYPPRAAWRAADLAGSQDWIYRFEPEALAELAAAAGNLPPDPQAWLGLRPAEIDAPVLKRFVARVVRELEFGRGVAVVKGFPVEGPLPETYRRYWILGALMGSPVAQNGSGHVLGEVTDKGSSYGSDPYARGYTSTDEMVFHTDAGDVAGLLCVRPAKAGGESAVVSTITLFEEAEATGDARLMAALRRGFRMLIRDDKETAAQSKDGARPPVTERRAPVFREWAGRLSGMVNLKSVRSVPEVTGQPMDPDEQAAFDFLLRTSERDDLKFGFRLEAGDLLLLHNLVVLHKRSSFTDHPEPERKRLLLRLWLALHEGRELPPEMAGLRRGFPASPVVNAPGAAP